MMYNYRDMTKALSECIQEINTGLINDDSVQNSMSLIQIRCAVLKMMDIINEGELEASADELKRIREYVDVCMSVLNIYRHINEIGIEIYKEEYLSEETCQVILNKLDYILRKMAKVLNNNEVSPMLVPFIKHITKKINLYNERVNKIMKNGHIK